VARKIAEGRKGRYRIDRDVVADYLGVEKIQPEPLLKESRIGVAAGLAWTPTGGDIIFVETLPMKGKGTLTLTGQLGDVMKESAQAAMSYARAEAGQFRIDPSTFENTDYHIHVPAGAIPKDGPSAGVTLAASLISAATGRPVHRDVALSGEITLRGQVLPVGGLKGKILAARRAKIKKVVLPKANQKDLPDLPKELAKEMEFLFADRMDDVIRYALQKEQKPAHRRKRRAGT
jgi:ATP-dependent Lon protease